jgi:hypothetical protein
MLVKYGTASAEGEPFPYPIGSSAADNNIYGSAIEGSRIKFFSLLLSFTCCRFLFTVEPVK